MGVQEDVLRPKFGGGVCVSGTSLAYNSAVLQIRVQLRLTDVNLCGGRTQPAVSVEVSAQLNCVRKMNRNKGQEMRRMRPLVLAETRSDLGKAAQTGNQSVTLSVQS